ncbi:hypothetical protein ACLOJK_012176 [Asimina triloba]
MLSYLQFKRQPHWNLCAKNLTNLSKHRSIKRSSARQISVAMKEEGQEEKQKEEQQQQQQNASSSSSALDMFRNMADKVDKLLMFLGFLGSVGDGSMNPLTMLILGSLLSSYGTAAQSLSQHLVDKRKGQVTLRDEEVWGAVGKTSLAKIIALTSQFASLMAPM